jgi:capsular polysaccharide biosynthesis protein
MRTMTATARSRLPASWPLWPYPAIGLLWLLGLSYLIWPAIGLFLAIGLIVRGNLQVPRRFGIWLLFLAWVGLSLTQVEGADRAMAWGYRAAMYLAATALFLYLYNVSRGSLRTSTAVNLLAIGWVSIVVIGFLGTLMPGISLKSPMHLILPGGITDIPLVRDMISPAFAKQNAFGGLGIHRTQAPFPYPNAWGSNFVLLTPFALWAFTTTARPRWRMWLAAVIALSVAPLILSLDRGAWLALALGAAYGAIRLAAGRDVRILKWGVVGIGVIMLLLLLTPLGSIITGRLERNYSDEGRIGRNLIAVDLVMEAPLLGYGAPQSSDDNPANASVGTHGQLWLVLVSQGFPGGLLYLGWLGFLLWRTGRRLRSASDPRFWPHLTFFMALVMLPYYEMLPLQIFTLMIAAALVLRAGWDGRARPGAIRLSDYGEILRANARVVVATTLVVTLLSGVALALRPAEVAVTTTVVVGPGVIDPAPVGETPRLLTEAEVAGSRVVSQRAVGLLGSEAPSPSVLHAATRVRAVPETRVLEITVTGSDADAARTQADAVARAFLQVERRLVNALEEARLDDLQRRRSEVVDRLDEAAAEFADAAPDSPAANRADEARTFLLGLMDRLDSQIRDIEGTIALPGWIVDRAGAAVPVGTSRARVLVTGLLVGLVLGCIGAFVRHGVRGHIRDVEDVEDALGAPVLSVFPPLARQRTTAKRVAAAKVLAVRDRPGGDEAEACRVLRAALTSSLPEGRGTVAICRSGRDDAAIAADVAADLALRGRSVLLLDLTTPRGTEPALGERPLDGLRVVAGGPVPGQGLDGERVAGALSGLSNQVDVVVIDAPPAGVADALPILARADVVVAAADADRANRADLRSLAETLARAGIALDGVVLRGRVVFTGRTTVEGPDRRPSAAPDPIRV